MDRMGLKEGEVIQHSMISKSIERAQRKVEENNFGMRKRLLEYDDVMNTQRTAIYKKRRNALFGERVEVDIANMVYDVCQVIVDENHGVTDFEDFKFQVIRYLSIESPVSEAEYLSMKADAIVEELYATAIEVFKRKMHTISDITFPILQHLHSERGKTLKEVIVPITDGKRVFNVLINLETAVRNKSRETVKSFEKTIILHTIDELWKEHLREMDDLKQSVQNASYEQKDPLLIYKFESFNLFKTMLDSNNKRVVSALMKGHLYAEQIENVKEAQERKRTDMSKYKTQKTEAGSTLKSQNPEQQTQTSEQGAKVQPITRTEPKIGRNDPCPCGSGKKYKQCHGKPVVIN
jgi:preprotein translocase subunit SecA